MQNDTQQISHEAMHSGVDSTKNAMEQVEAIPANVYFGGLIGSMAMSAVLFLMGKRRLGLFVGLGPPTLLNLAVFAKQVRPSHEMDRLQHSM